MHKYNIFFCANPQTWKFSDKSIDKSEFS